MADRLDVAIAFGILGLRKLMILKTQYLHLSRDLKYPDDLFVHASLYPILILGILRWLDKPISHYYLIPASSPTACHQHHALGNNGLLSDA
jgi:hypothetical protein